jgi:aminoglycoside 3-N-acetyltransferase
MLTVNKEGLIAGFKRIGLNPGSTVLVHSALSQFGRVDGGADTVIDAIIETVGESGTVLVPTLTGDETLSPENPPTFDLANTPGWTGIIPETLRKRPQAVRSLHPTHSAAAIGANAAMLTQDHHQSITPCDLFSPYGKLAQEEQGFILLLGVDHDANTTLHHVEEVVGVTYHLQKGLANCTLIVDGEQTKRHYYLHQYGTPRNFNVINQLLTERRIQRRVKIGKAEVRLIHAQSMVRLVAQCLRADAEFLCEKNAIEAGFDLKQDGK